MMSELQQIANDMRRWVECANEVQDKWRREGRDVDRTAVIYEAIAKHVVGKIEKIGPAQRHR